MNKKDQILRLVREGELTPEEAKRQIQLLNKKAKSNADNQNVIQFYLYNEESQDDIKVAIPVTLVHLLQKYKKYIEQINTKSNKINIEDVIKKIKSGKKGTIINLQQSDIKLNISVQ